MGDNSVDAVVKRDPNNYVVDPPGSWSMMDILFLLFIGALIYYYYVFRP